jgi:hypothetical protein
MAKDKEKEIAYIYYVEQGLNAKETAIKASVTEKTVGRWVAEGKWQAIRTAKQTGPESLIKNYYDLLNKLVEKRIELENGNDNPKYMGITDEISKISKNIESLKKDGRPSLRMNIYCVEQFFNKLLPVSEANGFKELLIHFTKQYIKDLAANEDNR